MKNRFKLIMALVLAAGVVSAQAYAADPTPAPAAKKQVKKTKPAAKPAPETVTPAQLQQLRREMEGQINSLKNDLADRDAKLVQAQQAAAAAQAAAAQAQQAAAAQQQALTDNATAVSTLSSTVTDLKTNQTQIAVTIQDDQAKVKKMIESPDTLHYKGITITPAGFVAGETVDRTKATGGDIPTAFSALPYEGADAYSLSEFYGTARQSRLALMAEGKTSFGTLRGYWEADFLGTGTSSNNNQSNSYVLRQRVVWAQAALNNGWGFTAGQLWSLAAEDKKGLSNLSGDIMTPITIDPNYVPGFVWERQFGFRVTKTFQHAAFGFAAENPKLLYTASLAGDTPYAVIGSGGNNGGAYNATISACSPSTSIVNYTNQSVTDSAGNTVNIAVPVYKTVNSCANISNYSFNYAPDLIVKAAFDPGWGHYEIFGIAGLAHETVYPGETTNSNLYGGLKDIKTGAVVAPALTATGSFAENVALTGLGGSLRVPVIPNVLTFGVKGLFGPGMGRYGNSTLADVTSNAHGELVAIHNASGLFTLEATPTPRLTLYANYGGDYAGRKDEAATFATTLGAPKAAQSAAGVWGGHWGAPSAAAVGYGSRLLNNSSCLTTANPGYNGSSTGYYPGGSCGAQTRDVQEATAGYWYDFYKGDHGRLRQGFQYAYAVREGWSGAPVSTVGPNGIGAKGIDNMFWTTFRYYLP